jgi:hypothetical protein
MLLCFPFQVWGNPSNCPPRPKVKKSLIPCVYKQGWTPLHQCLDKEFLLLPLSIHCVWGSMGWERESHSQFWLEAPDGQQSELQGSPNPAPVLSQSVRSQTSQEARDFPLSLRTPLPVTVMTWSGSLFLGLPLSSRVHSGMCSGSQLAISTSYQSRWKELLHSGLFASVSHPILQNLNTLKAIPVPQACSEYSLRVMACL